MIRAWRNQASCRTPGTPLAWLVQITRNEALRLAARRQRRRANEVAEVAPDRIPAESGLDRMIESVATEQALSVLRPEDRTLIRLRYQEDLTQGQVAQRLGIPEGTVKVRLHRARARLRGAVAELAA